MSVGGGCEAAVIVRTRYGWVRYRECGELPCLRGVSLRLKWAVCKSCVRPGILYWCEVCCLNGSGMEFLG